MALSEEQKAARAEKRRLTAALGEEARAHRHEERRREWVEKDRYLSREQAAAGEPCRGCGLPVIDNLGDWPPQMQLTPVERVAYDDVDARYRERHADCATHRWSMQGSRSTHCGLCCPPLPLSSAQIENLSRLMASFPSRHEEELDVWLLTLTCGHRVEHDVHHTNRHWSGSTIRCSECEVTHGIVTSELILEAADRMTQKQQKHDADLGQAEKEVARAEAAVAEARRKLVRMQESRAAIRA